MTDEKYKSIICCACGEYSIFLEDVQELAKLFGYKLVKIEGAK